MRRIIHKVQDLGKKAAEFKQVVQSAPNKAAELRQALMTTAGELQQIRTDVQSNLTGLRVNSEDRIIQAMREITEGTATFEEAGYALVAMDLDFSLTQRLAVRLEKLEEVPHATLRNLLAREVRQTIKPILSGMLKAEEMAASIELNGLTYSELIVHVGAVPAIRMGWRSDVIAEEVSPISAARTASAPPPLPASPAFGSFFEQRPPKPAVPESTLGVTTVAGVPAAMPPIEPAAPAEQPWSRNSLDRFKKMPDVSKYRRS